MTARPPADVGMPLEEVDTPALIIELDAFEANLTRMAQAAQSFRSGMIRSSVWRAKR